MLPCVPNYLPCPFRLTPREIEFIYIYLSFFSWVRDDGICCYATHTHHHHLSISPQQKLLLLNKFQDAHLIQIYSTKFIRNIMNFNKLHSFNILRIHMHHMHEIMIHVRYPYITHKLNESVEHKRQCLELLSKTIPIFVIIINKLPIRIQIEKGKHACIHTH